MGSVGEARFQRRAFLGQVRFQDGSHKTEWSSRGIGHPKPGASIREVAVPGARETWLRTHAPEEPASRVSHPAINRPAINLPAINLSCIQLSTCQPSTYQPINQPRHIGPSFSLLRFLLRSADSASLLARCVFGEGLALRSLAIPSFIHNGALWS